MGAKETSCYEKLPLEMLGGFYYYINKNIEDGILSDAMYNEINLIQQVADKKGISLTDLYHQGSLMKWSTCRTVPNASVAWGYLLRLVVKEDFKE